MSAAYIAFCCLEMGVARASHTVIYTFVFFPKLASCMLASATFFSQEVSKRSFVWLFVSLPSCNDRSIGTHGRRS